MGSDGEIHHLSGCCSQGKALLFKAPNVCLLFSTDVNLYRYHWMASGDLRAWVWVTITPGNRQWNCTFISQCSAQQYLSKATRLGWIRAAGDLWDSFILTPDCSRCLQLLKAALKLMASVQLGLGSRMTLRIPHMRQDPPPASAQLIQGLGLKCQNLERKGSFSWHLLLRLLYSLWPWIWW